MEAVINFNEKGRSAIKHWQDWIAGITARNKLGRPLNVGAQRAELLRVIW